MKKMGEKKEKWKKRTRVTDEKQDTEERQEQM